MDERWAEIFARGRTAVIGDVMLDHYVHGAVHAISPEAPVPVLHVAHERHVLGGAGNVAANIAALGGRAALIGVVGADAAGAQIAALVTALDGVEPALETCATHPSITKTRYLGDRQQIVRVDRELRAPLPEATAQALAARAAEAAAACDVIVLSDYGKGVLSDAVLHAVLTVAQAQGKPVIVDPKRARFSDYRGAAYITPNRKELEAAVGLPAGTDAQAEAAAAAAMAESGAAILLTRSDKGMALFRAGAPPIYLATRAREVFDVSGAGDTVVAAFAAVLAGGGEVDVAMRLANTAAGVVVGKLGTAVCTVAELEDALRREAGAVSGGEDAAVAGGAIPWAQALALRRAWRDQGLRVGFANGCFDLLHPGHIALLRKAAAEADRLIVAINADASVAALKGPGRPVQSEAARAAVLAGVKGVDAVTIFPEPTPRDLIAFLMPDVIVKGADYREDEVVGGDLVKAAGGRVALVSLVDGHSTSALVRRASEGG